MRTTPGNRRREAAIEAMRGYNLVKTKLLML